MAPKRLVLASLVAPIAALAPMTLLTAIELGLFDGPSSTEADDAPVRAGAAFLISLPLIYVAFAALAGLLGPIIAALGARSIWRFVSASWVTALLICVALSASLMKFGTGGLLWPVMIGTILATITALPGAVCWWWLARISERQPEIGRS